MQDSEMGVGEPWEKDKWPQGGWWCSSQGDVWCLYTLRERCRLGRHSPVDALPGKQRAS